MGQSVRLGYEYGISGQGGGAGHCWVIVFCFKNVTLITQKAWPAGNHCTFLDTCHSNLLILASTVSVVTFGLDVVGAILLTRFCSAGAYNPKIQQEF